MERSFRRSLAAAAPVPGSRLLLAVSGGVDSVVLLDLLARFGPGLGLELRVLHLDHRLRPESCVDALFVEELCQRLGIPCRIEAVDIAATARERGLSLETAGREVRRELLLSQARREDCTRVLLGHHRDDQAETLLQRLLRGSGTDGLQGMRVCNDLWWRPLLEFSRRQLLDYARVRGLEWVEDASNSDTRFLRNRIRHRLLPQLRDYNPRVGQRLADLSRQFQLEEDYWRQQVEGCWPDVLLTADDGLRLSRPRLLQTHPALRIRLMREGLRRFRGDLVSIDRVHLEAMLGLLDSPRPQAELDLPGCWVARRYEQLWLREQPPDAQPFDLQLRVDEPLPLPDGRWLLAEFCERPAGETPCRTEFAAGGLSLPLRVRSLLPGDRFRPSGMAGHRKVKDYLVDAKVEKEQRRALPLLLAGEEILWLVGLRRAGVALVGEGGGGVLAVRLLEAPRTATNPL